MEDTGGGYCQSRRHYVYKVSNIEVLPISKVGTTSLLLSIGIKVLVPTSYFVLHMIKFY